MSRKETPNSKARREAEEARRAELLTKQPPLTLTIAINPQTMVMTFVHNADSEASLGTLKEALTKANTSLDGVIAHLIEERVRAETNRPPPMLQ